MPKRRKVTLLARPRNWVTLVAIAQKGGAHGKAEKAERRAGHQRTEQAAREAFASREGGFRFVILGALSYLFRHRSHF